MGFVDHISFPATPEGKVVREYLTAQHKKDFSKGSEIFTKDAFFNGLLYKVKGRDELVKGFQDFVENALMSIRVEAVSQAGSDKFIVLHFSKLLGSDEATPFCDLLTMTDGKISRVDNCFDVNKISQEIQENARAVSNV